MLHRPGANSVQVAFVNVMAGILRDCLEPGFDVYSLAIALRLRHFLAPNSRTCTMLLLDRLLIPSFQLGTCLAMANAWPCLELPSRNNARYRELAGVLGSSTQYFGQCFGFGHHRPHAGKPTKSGISLLGAVLIFAAPYLINVL